MKQNRAIFVTMIALCTLTPFISKAQTCPSSAFETKKAAAMDFLKTSTVPANQTSYTQLTKALGDGSLAIEQLTVDSSQGKYEGIFTMRGNQGILQIACVDDVKQMSCDLAHELNHSIYQTSMDESFNTEAGLQQFQTLSQAFGLGYDLADGKQSLDSLSDQQKESLLNPIAHTVCTEYGAYNMTFICAGQTLDLDYVSDLLISTYIQPLYGVKVSKKLVSGIISACEKNTQTQDGHRIWGHVDVSQLLTDVSTNQDLKNQLKADISQQIQDSKPPTFQITNADCAFLSKDDSGNLIATIAVREEPLFLNEKSGQTTLNSLTPLSPGSEVTAHVTNDPAICGFLEKKYTMVKDISMKFDGTHMVFGTGKNTLHYFITGFK